MYATVWQYVGIAPGAVDELVLRRSDVEAVVLHTPGLVQYDLIATDGALTSVSVCWDRAGAEESNERIAAWITENMPGLLPGRPRSASGEDIIHLTVGNGGPRSG